MYKSNKYALPRSAWNKYLSFSMRMADFISRVYAYSNVENFGQKSFGIRLCPILSETFCSLKFKAEESFKSVFNLRM